MAEPRNIGRVVVDVTADASKTRASIQKALEKPFKASVVFSHAQVQAALTKASKGLIVTARVEFVGDDVRKFYSRAELDAKKGEARIGLVQERGRVQRALQAQRSRDKLLTDEAKASEQRLTNDRKLAGQRELIALRNAATLQQIAARSQAKIDALANRPISTKIRTSIDAISNSLNDFSRVATRVLTSSIRAFALWSTAVSASVGIAATAGIVAFAKLESAATHAATVVASQQRIDEIDKYGKAITDFGIVTEEARKRVEAVASRVAIQTIFDPTEISEGIGQLVQSGQSLPEAFTNIGAAANFASVNNADLNETTKGLATALASAGLSANDSALLLDKISVTAAQAVGDVDDYFTAFSNGAAAAGRIIGATTDETLFVLRLLGQAGTLGLEAGTQVDIIFRDLGRSAIKAADEWKKYGLTANASVTEQLVVLSKAIESVGTNRIEQAKLRAELGLQEKSFRALSRIIPQVQRLGVDSASRLAQVQRAIRQTSEGAGGIVGLALEEQRKTISFQFDQLLDSFKIAFQTFGAGTRDAVAGLFDEFAGPGGLISQALPTIRAWGVEFGKLLARITAFIKTDEFRTGIKTLVESVQITLRGISEAFKEFSEAFGGAKEGESAFVAFARTIRAFAQLAATVLPIVARITGQIINFLIEHKDAFETFAKITVALIVLRGAYALLLRPLLVAHESLVKFGTAMTVLSAKENANAITQFLAGLAVRFGLVSKSAKSATVAVEGFTAAQTALATANAAATSSAATKALAGARAGIAERNAIDATSKAAGRLKLSLRGFGIGLAIFGAFKFGSGFISGFRSEMDNVRKRSPGLDRALRRIASALRAVGDAAKFALDFLEKFGEKSNEFGRGTGKGFADSLGDTADALERINRLRGDFEGENVGFGKRLSLGFQELRDNADLAAANISQSLSFIDKSFQESADRTRAEVEARRAFRDGKEDIVAFGDTIKTVSSLIEKNLSDASRRAAANISQIRLRFASTHGTLKNFAEKAKSASDAMLQNGTASSVAAVNLNKLAGGKGAVQSMFTAIEKGSKSAAIQLKALYKASVELAQQQLKSDVIARTASIENPIEQLLARQAGRLEIQNAAYRSSKAIADFNKSIDDAFNTDLGGGGGGGDTPIENGFDSVKTAADLATEAVDKLTAAQFRSASQRTINRVAKIGDAYRATAYEAELLKRSLPGIDAQLEKQRETVQSLDAALQKLQETQLAGTKRFSDAAFRSEQAIKRLQLQRLELIIGGAAEDDLRITEIDKSIEDLQRRAERASLIESLQLDPLRRKLQDTFKPVQEITFAKAIDQFNKLSRVRTKAQNEIGVQEELRAKLDTVIAQSADKFTAVGKNITLGVATGVKQGKAAVIKSATATADAYLKEFDRAFQIASPSKVMIERGNMIVKGLTIGVDQSSSEFTSQGSKLLTGFFAGMLNVWNERIKPFILAIPGWIRKNKGPLAYDAGLLVPAGEAIMQGFHRGLRTGFSSVQAFVRDVAPSISETVTADMFNDRLAPFMVDVALGKTPDPYESFKDLVPPEYASWIGALDPTLSFLHRPLSAADTLQMAQQLAKLFGVSITSFDTGEHAAHSYHYRGLAADFSNGVTTPQEDALYGALQPFKGKVFAELLYRTMLGGNHFNHVHAAWIPAKGFEQFSGEIAQVFKDIPGASTIVDRALNAAASATKVPLNLLAAVAKAESSFNPYARSSAGAQGLMQLLPSTARGFGVTNIYDPFQNALGGAKFLKNLLRMFSGNTSLALAGYNAGPGAASRALTSFPETIAYVSRVLKFMSNFGGFREHGGSTQAGKYYVAGEKGPEVIRFDRPGYVHTAAESSRMMGGPTFMDNRNIHVYTNATDAHAVGAMVDAHTRWNLGGVQR